MAWQRLIAVIIRFGIGGFFIIAGLIKIVDPAGFAFEIDHYQLLPWVAVAAVALYLPWLELLCGIALITRCWSRAAAMLILMMLIVFVIALGSAWIRGLDISCGCLGGEGNASNIPMVILRDLVMICGILHILMRKR